MNKDAFSGFHPAVNLAFFLAVLAMTMLIVHPVCLVISMAGGCAYLLYLQGRKGFLRQVGYLVPLLGIMAMVNPIFNHEGITVLCYLANDNPITLEAICFGLASAVMMGASIVWFNCCNTVLTSDKIIYLFGRVVPALSLLISMTLRFVPRFKNYLQSVLRTQQAMHRPKNKREQLQQALSAFSSTVSWAMEQSIISADSMKSRGFGMGRRTAFSIYRFDKRDGAALGILVLLCIGASVPHLLGQMDWTYYPSLAGQLLGPVQLVSYLSYGGLCHLPLMIALLEDRKWKAWRSKI
jgi:energy-coupling factor transport system permease protein